MKRAAVACAFVLVAAACEGENPMAPKDAEIGKPFDLKAGETALVAQASLRVGFTAVRNDSRCPIGVQCIWEGDAEVEVTLEKPPQAKETHLLHTSGRFEREVVYLGLKVALKDVLPYPREGVTIRAKEYRATILVETAP
ncbi:MAG: hypothetical protein HY317_02665 [Acidobacteria bacterium]|nr:hypothetical protein [Acidobacteriota bacterium]